MSFEASIKTKLGEGHFPPDLYCALPGINKEPIEKHQPRSCGTAPNREIPPLPAENHSSPLFHEVTGETTSTRSAITFDKLELKRAARIVTARTTRMVRGAAIFIITHRFRLSVLLLVSATVSAYFLVTSFLRSTETKYGQMSVHRILAKRFPLRLNDDATGLRLYAVNEYKTQPTYCCTSPVICLSLRSLSKCIKTKCYMQLLNITTIILLLHYSTILPYFTNYTKAMWVLYTYIIDTIN